MRTRRVLHSPTVEPEPFDPAAFPGLEERRRADGGAASARWRELLDANTTIIADGAMGTMLFANGLHVRRPARGLEPVQAGRHPPDPPRLPRRRLADPHDQHVRRQPDAAQPARPPGPRRGAQPDRGDPAAQRGRRRRRRRPRGRRHRSERRDPRADRHARLRRGGRHLRRAGGRAGGRRRRPHLDRDDVRPARDQGRHRGRPARVAGHRAHHDDDLRHARPHDDGRLARSRPSRRSARGAPTRSAATAATDPTS